MSTHEMRSTFDSTAGGVRTKEVGAITGELELSTCRAQRTLEVLVRYAGAEEWYTVEGGPISSPEETDQGYLHERIVKHLTRPGPVKNGNEEPVFLASFSQLP